jgi:hypothetical protein
VPYEQTFKNQTKLSGFLILGRLTRDLPYTTLEEDLILEQRLVSNL